MESEGKAWEEGLGDALPADPLNHEEPKSFLKLGGRDSDYGTSCKHGLQ